MIDQLPAMTSTDAEAAGFAPFNRCPTLCVDVPDGGFTISAKTSQGKRVTFYFGPYATGGAPQFIDVQYHDDPAPKWDNNGTPIPTFDVLAFTRGTTGYDSRKRDDDAKRPTLVCLLMEDPK